MADISVTGLSNVCTRMFRRSGVACGEDSTERMPINVDDFKLVSESVASNDSGIGDCDWEVDPETGLKVISLEQVACHCTMEDGWMVIYDKVYEVTGYLERGSHPGGEDVMLEYLGYDATMAFRGVGHSKGALRMLEKYVIGILPRDERLHFRSDY